MRIIAAVVVLVTACTTRTPNPGDTAVVESARGTAAPAREPRDSATEPTMEIGPDGKLHPIKR